MRLSILCWNIQKRSLTPAFRHVFEHLLEAYGAHIVAIQEVRLPHGHMPACFKPFSHALSCNIVRSRECYGVMTLSRYPLLTARPYLSKTREVGVATRKSAVLTIHHLPDGERLAVLNVHAINFVPYTLFERELERLAGLLSEVGEKRLIVAGDFNTWNGKRQGLLEHAMRDFGLEKAEPENGKTIKSILGKPLDHIYYRGLRLERATVVDTPVSDHNPIHALFSVKPESP